MKSLLVCSYRLSSSSFNVSLVLLVMSSLHLWPFTFGEVVSAFETSPVFITSPHDMLCLCDHCPSVVHVAQDYRA